MSDARFQQAKGSLAFSQNLLDQVRPPNMAQPQPQMGIAESTPALPAMPSQPQVAPAVSPFDSPVLQIPKIEPTNTPQPVEQPSVDVRGVKASTEEVQKLKHAIFSEVSNRLSPVEVTAMLNVAINKAKETGKSLGEVADDPNFFQGITNKRYGTTSPQGADKNVQDFVGNTVDSYLSGDKVDHTNGATHFVHITSGKGKDKLVTMTEKEFDTYLSKKGDDRDKYAEDLITN